MNKCFSYNLISFIAIMLFGLVYVSVLSATPTLTIESDGEKTFSLFGIAMHRKFRKDIYIAAIFTSKSTENLEGLKEQSTSKRMHFKFVRQCSNRAFLRALKQNIVLNNSKKKYLRLSGELAQFISIFKRDLQAGDELILDYVPLGGTNVYLNGTLFISIKNPGFFELLLNMWIGKILPSKEFQKGIIGESEESMRRFLFRMYTENIPEPNRFDNDKALVALENESSKNKGTVLSLPPIDKARVKGRADAIARSDRRSTNSFKENLPPKLDNIASTKNMGKTKEDGKKNKVTNTSSNGAKIMTKGSKIESRKITKKHDIAKKNVSKNIVVNAKKDSPPVNKIALRDKTTQASSSIATSAVVNSYIKKLVNITQKFQKYPVKAIMNRMEGEALIRVIINSKGEVMSNLLIKKTRHKVLNAVAIDMVKRASPYPAIPKELNKKEIEFDVPINFVLNKAKRSR